MLSIAIAQMNPVLGDMRVNAAKIAQFAETAKAKGADILLVPELALCGYCPEDLLLRDSFYKDCYHALEDLEEQVRGITMVIGYPQKVGHERFNAAAVIRDGRWITHYQKMLLPNDAVFDEVRYFSPGAAACVFEQNGVQVGVLICEDIWDVVPASETEECGAELILVLNASPYHQAKQQERLAVVQERVEETGLPIIYANMVGGQDELVFDGGSFALNRSGSLVAQLPMFEETYAVLTYREGDLEMGDILPEPPLLESTYRALVLGVRDYITKNRFPGVLLGLSGGIDSALTLAIAVDALGAGAVHAVMMPSQYTADISVTDSREMVETLGVKYSEIAIKPMYDQFVGALAGEFAGLAADTTEENIQARVRGTLLMALSNKTGKLVVTTGNKSEMAVGYCTLYGDMAGGFAVLKDVKKTLVYQLADYRNSLSDCIPQRIIDRPPSAELRPDQTDQDSLPPYDVLDAIMEAYVEQDRSPAEIIKLGYTEADVKRVVKLIKINEYKRRQSPVGVRITARGYGKDWRYPITTRYPEL